MAIIYNPNKKSLPCNTAHTTYQMQVDPLGYLLHLYYGKNKQFHGLCLNL